MSSETSTIEKLVTREKEVTYIKKEVNLCGEWVSYRELIEVMEGLYSSTMVEPIVIYSKAIQDGLEKMDVLHRNSRGSVYKGDNFFEFADTLGI